MSLGLAIVLRVVDRAQPQLAQGPRQQLLRAPCSLIAHETNVAPHTRGQWLLHLAVTTLGSLSLVAFTSLAVPHQRLLPQLLGSRLLGCGQRAGRRTAPDAEAFENGTQAHVQSVAVYVRSDELIANRGDETLEGGLRAGSLPSE
jgi:hypothetical protein